MDTTRVPAALQERLGEDATAGLVELLSDARRTWIADVIEIVGDRFERRLVEETSNLRVEMAQGFAAVRRELAEGLSAVRREMAEGLSAVRKEMTEGLSAVRKEMTEGLSAVRKEMTEGLSAVRQEMTRESSSLRQEMAAGFASLRQEMAEQRFELLKWAFLFWVGQLFAMATLMAVLIRVVRAGA